MHKTIIMHNIIKILDFAITIDRGYLKTASFVVVKFNQSIIVNIVQNN